MRIPTDFSNKVSDIQRLVSDVEGFLSPQEIDMLALLVACPTADGAVLEIGSHKGRSTVVMAKAGEMLSDGTQAGELHACDPLTSPAATDPTLYTKDVRDVFDKNLSNAGVTDKVTFHQMLSSELAPTWNKPLRLLWIDGDHTYAGAKLDFDLFSPHLVPGAIVALHDVLHDFAGPIRVVMEDILLSPCFDYAGVCANIGWGRYIGPSKTFHRFDERMCLYRKLARLIPHQLDKRRPSFLRRKFYLLWRLLVPHGPVDPAWWVDEVQGAKMPVDRV